MSDLALVHVNEDDIAKAEKATKVPVVNGGENNDRYSSRYFSSEGHQTRVSKMAKCASMV
jgi:hypothetical protein